MELRTSSLEFFPLIIREITVDDPAYPQVWELRDAVLRRPLGQSLHNDDTSGDHLERIFIAEYDAARVVACVMLRPLRDKAFKLRQMVVAPEAQGTGVGRALVQVAEESVFREGAARIEMNARAVVLPFYEKLGYTIEGDGFIEVGIPHFFMQKKRPA